MYFKYGSEEIEFLKSRDDLLGAAIERIGHIYRVVDNNLFSSVIHHIIGQQISTRAQATIWQRLNDRVEGIQPDTICSIETEELQKLGMTFRKTDYIKEFAQKVKSKEIDLDALINRSDSMVVKELSALKGIGVWTAEMIMIFCLQRPDVLSYGDLAIHRGMRMLYHHRNIDKKKFEKYAKRYSPYGTVASLYLWAIAGGAIGEMRDYAPKKKGAAKNDTRRNVESGIRKRCSL
ncbi:MAG: DNA-3-methyladenine glycosylase 2 family protein [Selenomonadaceae bacterium]